MAQIQLGSAPWVRTPPARLNHMGHSKTSDAEHLGAPYQTVQPNDGSDRDEGGRSKKLLLLLLFRIMYENIFGQYMTTRVPLCLKCLKCHCT